MLAAPSSSRSAMSATTVLIETSHARPKYTPGHDLQDMLTTSAAQSVVPAASECPAHGPLNTHPGDPSPSVSTDSLPPTYLALPQTTKLEEEPNPFEQSFSSSRIDGKETPRPVLPPLASIESPTRGLGFRRKEVVIWDSLRTGPLSPSMLTGPADDKRPPPTPMKGTGSSFFSSSSSSSSISSSLSPLSQHSGIRGNNAAPHQQRSSSFAKPDPSVNRAHNSSPTSGLGNSTIPPSCPPPSSSSCLTADAAPSTTSKTPPPSPSFVTPAPEIGFPQPSSRGQSAIKQTDGDEKRKSFLERNRLAAYKCRQRKKQWMQDLQTRVEFLTTDNEQLQAHVTTLREELLDLKTMLLEHKTCSVAPQAVIEALNRPIPGMTPRSQYRTAASAGTRYSPYPSSRRIHSAAASRLYPSAESL